MKKFSRYILIVITNIILPTFSFSSLAKDCPIISETIKEVTVKNSAATLRTEPKYSNNNKGPAINENDKLTVILPKPEMGPDKQNNTLCWYKVRPVNTSNQKEYWIADIGINEFPFESKTPLSEQYQENTNQATNFSILIIFIGLGALSVSGIVFSLYCISLFKKYDKKIETLQETIEVIVIQINNIQKKYLKIKEQITYQFNGQTHLNAQLNEQLKELLEVTQNNPQYKSFHLSFELKELVKQFNISNVDYFLDPRFVPLTLTQQTIHADFDSNVSRIIQLEVPSDNLQASYLKIEIYQENWLILNIISPYIRRIIANLDKNSEVFIVHPGSGALQLIRPAKLKNIGFDLWEIEEPGIFTRQDMTSEIDLPPFHNLPSQNITSSPNLSPETINPKEIDLGILYYLRKNENASFIDLLSNLQCDKPHLRDRLLILQEEEFIKIVNKSDENNTIYKML